MSTNILLINGSPKGKKSNTYKLATAFIEGLKEEQLPPIIIKSSKDSLSFFTVGKKIAGFGSLSKEGNDWVIWCIQTTELN
jgi:hypothetical protein